MQLQVEGNIFTFWFDVLCARSTHVEVGIILDLDGMSRIIGGEILYVDKFPRAFKLLKGGPVSFDSDEQIISLRFTDDARCLNSIEVFGQVLFDADNTFVGVRVTLDEFAAVATQQLYRTQMID